MNNNANDDIDTFYAKHKAGGPNNVVLALIIDDDGSSDRYAVFSCIDRAKEWVETLGDEDISGVVFSPYVVDFPEWGDIPHGKLS